MKEMSSRHTQEMFSILQCCGLRHIINNNKPENAGFTGPQKYCNSCLDFENHANLLLGKPAHNGFQPQSLILPFADNKTYVETPHTDVTPTTPHTDVTPTTPHTDVTTTTPHTNVTPTTPHTDDTNTTPHTNDTPTTETTSTTTALTPHTDDTNTTSSTPSPITVCHPVGQL